MHFVGLLFLSWKRGQGRAGQNIIRKKTNLQRRGETLTKRGGTRREKNMESQKEERVHRAIWGNYTRN